VKLGHEVAKFVTNHFIEELLKNASYKSGDYSKALTEAFLRMDELLRTSEGRRELAGIQSGNGRGNDNAEADSFAGCTSVVALMVKDKLYVANSGDSRCVLATKGDVVAMTEDHKTNNKEEKDRIEKAGGEVYEGRINGRLNLSRALGDFDYKGNDQLGLHEQLVIPHPEITTRSLSSDDEFLILGCDGIWECLPAKQIYEFVNTKVKNGKNLRESIEDLLDYIVAGDTSSNKNF